MHLQRVASVKLSGLDHEARLKRAGENTGPRPGTQRSFLAEPAQGRAISAKKSLVLVFLA